MTPALSNRRYLLPFHAHRLPQQVTDVLVIGGGVAGLRAAIAAAQAGSEVLLLTKDMVEQSNTWYAQGGIAAAIQESDSVESHVKDTLVVGVGLCDEKAVRVVVEEGIARVLELLEWGAHFDKKIDKPHELAFGLEGGHSFARILHAYGDATGKELAQTLIRTARSFDNVRISERSFAIDFLTNEAGRCVGVIALIGGQLQVIWAQQTILASGGAGQLFRESTNPRIATGDGHAMAYRAGATMSDMEMVQFHPTTLYVAGASRALITEAVRGEGAYLIDHDGKRFMPEYHKDAELAPRDVVSRAIVEQIRKTNYTHVFLDVRHLEQTRFKERFPQLAILCDEFDINPATDPIPIHPATHYFIGGVVADLDGQSSVDGLYAIGEASCSGLHGANRLASNSLLEGLAFGARAGTHAAARAKTEPIEFPHQLTSIVPDSKRTELDVTDVKSSLRALMWRNVGIERAGDRLTEALEIISLWSRYTMDKIFDPKVVGVEAAVAGWELQNMLAICNLITAAARARTESRGTHFRLDHPKRDDEKWLAHLQWNRTQSGPSLVPSPVMYS